MIGAALIINYIYQPLIDVILVAQVTLNHWLMSPHSWSLLGGYTRKAAIYEGIVKAFNIPFTFEKWLYKTKKES
jgi:hypothetical protein